MKEHNTYNNGFFVNCLRKFVRNRMAMIGVTVLLIIVLSCMLIPIFVSLDPFSVNIPNRFKTPSPGHPLGTDSLGRDLFARILYGGRNTLLITFIAVVIPAFFGSILGIVSSYFGGKFDFFVMRAVDALSSIPSFLLVIVTECALGWGGGNFIYGLAIAGIPSFAKLMRASTLDIMGSEYIEASRALGASHFSILRKHVLHNVASGFIIQLSTSFSDTLLICTLLGYLGIGLTPPTPEWGNMFFESQSAIFSHAYITMLPCAAIVITMMCLHFIGNGLRDALGINGGRK